MGFLHNGWFPGLYLVAIHQTDEEHPSTTSNPVVVDVRTDRRDDECSGDPGAILHQNTGRAQFMITSVEPADGSSCTYGGPLTSHYEFTTELGIRLSNEDWVSKPFDPPTFAAWKHGFMVPDSGE